MEDSDRAQGTALSRRGFIGSAAVAGLAAGAVVEAAEPRPACGAPAGFVQKGTPLQVRRVVTGHDAQGRSIVTIDESIGKITSARAGHQDALVWTSPVPADNTDVADGALRPEPRQSVFRITRYDPGVAPRNHATQTIDYAIVLSGEIDMELDTGTVRLRQGDALVQRGTIHNWVNRGTDPCVVAFILIEAKR
jgi:quercetin dioxygenase-like cupin family protein